MKRSSNSSKTQKLNAAIAIRQRYGSLSEASSAFADSQEISKRQAYRYLKDAEMLEESQPIPEAKTVFTVKLPVGLVQKLRAYSQTKNQSLSELVTVALQRLLRRGDNGEADHL